GRCPGPTSRPRGPGPPPPPHRTDRPRPPRRTPRPRRAAPGAPAQRRPSPRWPARRRARSAPAESRCRTPLPDRRRPRRPAAPAASLRGASPSSAPTSAPPPAWSPSGPPPPVPRRSARPPPGRRSAPGTRPRCWWPSRSARRPRPAPPPRPHRAPPRRTRPAPGSPATRRRPPPPACAPSRAPPSSQPRFGGPHQDPPAVLAAQHLVGGGLADPAQLGRAQRQLAPLAPAVVQRRRPDPVLVPQLGVERQQVLGDLLGQPLAAVPLGGALVLDLQRRGGAALLRRLPAGLRPLQFGGDRRRLGLRGLAALHHLQHHLLQLRLAALERGDLRLQPLQLLGRGHLAGVQPGAVPVGPGAHLVHVGLGLALLPVDVGQGGPGGHRPVPQLGDAGVQLPHLLGLREVAGPVLRTGDRGVGLLHV